MEVKTYKFINVCWAKTLLTFVAAGTVAQLSLIVQIRSTGCLH